MFEILNYSFFTNALFVSFLISIVCSLIGTYIVVRRMSLISGSIAHTAFGGLGISYFFSFNPLIGGMIFSLLSSFLIAFLKEFQKNKIDSILSFLWAFSMAIGLFFIFLTPGYQTDLFSYLFGNILLVSSFDIILIFILTLIVILMVYFFYEIFLFVSFDEEYCKSKNIPVVLINMLLFGLIAISIIATIRVVGIVLMIAILTIPPSCAMLFFNNLKKIMFFSFFITFFSCVFGLFFSYFFNLSTSPIIVLFISFLYLILLFLKRN